MKALSIRQPWAWLILHAGKDIENRSWPTKLRGRILIHAAKGMSKADYQAGLDTLASINSSIALPTQRQLFWERGGIVGSVEIVDCIQESDSPWFFGPYGFVLRDPNPMPFRQMKGRLGFFEVPEIGGRCHRLHYSRSLAKPHAGNVAAGAL